MPDSEIEVMPESKKPNKAEDVWKETRGGLLSDLRSMINGPESSDVVLKCSDGVGVHACRLLLASRCAVFKGMLRNGMLESNQTDISLPTFPSSVILSIVEYLYTGAIESYCPRDWKTGFEMITAAHFFIIPAVEKFAQKFLWTQFDGQTEKSGLMEMLSIAVDFEEMWDDKEELLQGLVDRIGPDWSDEDCCRKLSRKAVEYILCSSERDCAIGEKDLSVEEYFTFRKIVLWHVYQTLPTGTVEAKVAIQIILPAEEPSLLWQRMLKVPGNINSFLSNMSTSVESFDSSATLNCLLGTKVCKDSLVQLLTLINLRLIPAPLLLKVIHPLKIIPSQQLLEALIQGAMHRRSLARFDWKHGPSLKIGSYGEIVCSNEDKTGRGIGIAVIPSPRSGDVLEWNFRILDGDAEFIELGLVCEPTGNLGTGGLDEKLTGNLWDRPSSRVLLICPGNPHEVTELCVSKNLPILNVTAEQFWDSWECFDLEDEVDSVVNFRLNKLEKTCRVTIGKSHESMWEGLPDGDYHPAVGFKSSRLARVELRLARGFDSF